MEVNSVGFEGLGISPFNLNKVAFSIGENFNVYWYAIIITVGMILAVIFAMKFAKKLGLTADNVVDCALWGTPFALIGARLYYIIFSIDSFKAADGSLDFLAMLDVRNGGLAIYGGIIFGFVTALIVCKIKKIKALAFFDIAALGFLIGQAIGRWGNFVNAEAYGGLTDVPWGMTINGAGPYHPTFLYESLWNVVGFVLLLLFTLFLRKHRGETFFGYMIWYGAGRAWIEGLRTDSLWLFSDSFKKALGLNFNMRVSQVLSIVIVVAGIVLFILARFGIFDKLAESHAAKREKKRLAKAGANGVSVEEYTPVFLTKEGSADDIENNDEIISDGEIEDELVIESEIEDEMPEDTDVLPDDYSSVQEETEDDNGSKNN